MGITLANNAHTTLSADASSTDTTIYVDDIDSFPTLGVGDYFYLTLERTSGALEIVKVTQINSSSFVVERGQESTIPISFSIGSMAKLNMTVQNITDLIVTGSNVDDSAYSSDWNGDTDDAPSRNAVYDKIETLQDNSAVLDAITAGATFDGNTFSIGSTTGGTNDYMYEVRCDDTAGASAALKLSVGGIHNWLLQATHDGNLSLYNTFAGTNVYTIDTTTNDFTFVSAPFVPDEVYSSNWNGHLDVPTKNAVYDKIETLLPSASYTAADVLSKLLTVDGAGSGLDADLLDGLSSAAFAQLSGATFFGTVTLANGTLICGDSGFTADANMTIKYDGTTGTGSLLWEKAGTTVWYARSGSSGSWFLRNSALGTSAVSFAVANNNATFTGTVTVPDDAYAAGWDGNLTVPTKNAVYDKIEGLSALYQGLDADLTSWAAVTRATGFDTFVTTPSSVNLKALVTDETGSGALVFATSPTLVTPILGTPTSGTLTSCTGLPISTGVSGLGTGVATFLATPSSANLIAAVTNETGTGSLVFATSPTLVTPALGVATATSIQAPPKISSETTGALTSASRNCIVQCSGGVTLPASGMSDGDSILIDPRGTARTITRPGAHTMYIANTDSATGTTGAHNVVTAVYHGSSKWTVQGSVS